MFDRFANSDFSSSLIPFEIEPGSFLVASPALRGSPFEQTVVLVLQSNREGTFGVVLNRLANEEIRLAYQQITGSEPDEQSIVHGGPIRGPVFALHQKPDLGELEVIGGVFVSSTSEDLRLLSDQDETGFRIVFGLTGWRPGQVIQEINEGLWLRLEANAEAVFSDPTRMWEKSFRRYGREQLRDVVGLDRFPDDPSLN